MKKLKDKVIKILLKKVLDFSYREVKHNGLK